MENTTNQKEDFKIKLENFREEEKLFLDRNADLQGLLRAENWVQRNPANLRFEKKGMIVDLQKVRQGWAWGIDGAEPSNTSSIGLLLKYENHADVQQKKKPWQYRQDAVVATRRYMLSSAKAEVIQSYNALIRKHRDITDWLSKQGEVFFGKNKSYSKPEEKKESNENKLTEFLLTEVSLFKLALNAGYAVREVISNDQVPAETINEIRKKADLLITARKLGSVTPIGNDNYKASAGGKDVVINHERNEVFIEGNNETDQGRKFSVIDMAIFLTGKTFKDIIKDLGQQTGIDVSPIQKKFSEPRHVKEKTMLTIMKEKSSGRYLFHEVNTGRSGDAIAFIQMEALREGRNLTREQARGKLIMESMEFLPEEKLELLSELLRDENKDEQAAVKTEKKKQEEEQEHVVAEKKQKEEEEEQQQDIPLEDILQNFNPNKGGNSIKM
ncbi:MAG TPA: hypothetical protein VGQ59_08325 [Cyclobacteriaceae bacterium]|jgi:hypothetical protein|nr:hypothetical protein [Cyclobacteriaceae bacterium]